MSVLSKILNEEWSIPFNCYEIGHFWTPYCSDAALEVALVAFQESLKIYGPLYLASQIIFTRKFTPDAFMESFKSIMRSSTFLSMNALNMVLFFCLTREMTGKFYYRVHAFLPTFTASFLAILIEKPTRRYALAAYVANIASECLFKICVDSGYIKTLPKGEVILFTMTMSVLMYIIKKQGFGHDPVSLALRYYLGRDEAKSNRKMIPRQIVNGSSSPNDSIKVDSNRNKLGLTSSYDDPSFLNSLQSFLSSSKHSTCTHSENSCLNYSLSGFLKPFVATWVGHAVLSSAKKYQQILKDPKIFFADRLFSERSIRFGLFFGTFSAVFKTASCLLRRHSNGPQDWHGLVAGAAAGPSMLFYPNSTITLYLFWKTLESLYWIQEKKGNFKHPVTTANILYALAVSQIAYCVLLQPKHIRPSYMRFIDQITAHRFHVINRMALNILVPDAALGYEEWFPDLTPDLMSKKFMESTFVWMI